MLAYFAGRPAGRTWRQSGSTTDAPPFAHKGRAAFRPFAMLDLECAYVTVWRLVMNQLKGLHDRAELSRALGWRWERRDPNSVSLETDWPVGAAGFEPLH